MNGLKWYPRLLKVGTTEFQYKYLIVLKNTDMSKQKESKKNIKKAPVKNLKEKRETKAAKRAEK